MELPSNVMRGKTVLITGGTGGIGRATAEALATLGAQVVIVGRDANRGEVAIRELQQASGSQAHYFLRADLSSQSEVRRLVDEFQGRFSHLHVLVNNVAGVYRQRKETIDGVEATLALGHLAPFLLTHLLLPLLQTSSPSRIVNVTSDGHSMAKLDFDEMGFLGCEFTALGDTVDLLSCIFRYLGFDNAGAVFRTKHDVIFALIE